MSSFMSDEASVVVRQYERDKAWIILWFVGFCVLITFVLFVITAYRWGYAVGQDDLQEQVNRNVEKVQQAVRHIEKINNG